MKDRAIMSVKEEILAIARQYNINYQENDLDNWANTVTSLADDTVELDEIGYLLVAIGRAKVIPGMEVNKLHSRYLDER